jgi:hypothetical protein
MELAGVGVKLPLGFGEVEILRLPTIPQTEPHRFVVGVCTKKHTVPTFLFHHLRLPCGECPPVATITLAGDMKLPASLG